MNSYTCWIQRYCTVTIEMAPSAHREKEREKKRLYHTPWRLPCCLEIFIYYFSGPWIQQYNKKKKYMVSMVSRNRLRMELHIRVKCKKWKSWRLRVKGPLFKVQVNNGKIRGDGMEVTFDLFLFSFLFSVFGYWFLIR